MEWNSDSQDDLTAETNEPVQPDDQAEPDDDPVQPDHVSESDDDNSTTGSLETTVPFEEISSDCEEALGPATQSGDDNSDHDYIEYIEESIQLNSDNEDGGEDVEILSESIVEMANNPLEFDTNSRHSSEINVEVGSPTTNHPCPDQAPDVIEEGEDALQDNSLQDLNEIVLENSLQNLNRKRLDFFSVSSGFVSWLNRTPSPPEIVASSSSNSPSPPPCSRASNLESSSPQPVPPPRPPGSHERPDSDSSPLSQRVLSSALQSFIDDRDLDLPSLPSLPSVTESEEEDSSPSPIASTPVHFLHNVSDDSDIELAESVKEGGQSQSNLIIDQQTHSPAPSVSPQIYHHLPFSLIPEISTIPDSPESMDSEPIPEQEPIQIPTVSRHRPLCRLPEPQQSNSRIPEDLTLPSNSRISQDLTLPSNSRIPQDLTLPMEISPPVTPPNTTNLPTPVPAILPSIPESSRSGQQDQQRDQTSGSDTRQIHRQILTRLRECSQRGSGESSLVHVGSESRQAAVVFDDDDEEEETREDTRILEEQRATVSNRSSGSRHGNLAFDDNEEGTRDDARTRFMKERLNGRIEVLRQTIRNIRSIASPYLEEELREAASQNQDPRADRTGASESQQEVSRSRFRQNDAAWVEDEVDISERPPQDEMSFTRSASPQRRGENNSEIPRLPQLELPRDTFNEAPGRANQSSSQTEADSRVRNDDASSTNGEAAQSPILRSLRRARRGLPTVAVRRSRSIESIRNDRNTEMDLSRGSNEVVPPMYSPIRLEEGPQPNPVHTYIPSSQSQTLRHPPSPAWRPRNTDVNSREGRAYGALVRAFQTSRALANLEQTTGSSLASREQTSNTSSSGEQTSSGASSLTRSNDDSDTSSRTPAWRLVPLRDLHQGQGSHQRRFLNLNRDSNNPLFPSSSLSNSLERNSRYNRVTQSSAQHPKRPRITTERWTTIEEDARSVLEESSDEDDIVIKHTSGSYAAPSEPSTNPKPGPAPSSRRFSRDRQDQEASQSSPIIRSRQSYPARQIQFNRRQSQENARQITVLEARTVRSADEDTSISRTDDAVTVPQSSPESIRAMPVTRFCEWARLEPRALSEDIADEPAEREMLVEVEDPGDILEIGDRRVSSQTERRPQIEAGGRSVSPRIETGGRPATPQLQTLASSQTSAPMNGSYGSYEADLHEAIKRSLEDMTGPLEEETANSSTAPGVEAGVEVSAEAETPRTDDESRDLPLPRGSGTEAVGSPRPGCSHWGNVNGAGSQAAVSSTSRKTASDSVNWEFKYNELLQKHLKLVSELQSSVECPVCMEIPRSAPIPCCKNGHVMCSSCFSRSRQCPTCRLALPERCVSHIANRLVDLLPHPCTNRDLGCPYEAPVNDLPKHEQECEFRLIKCPSYRCKKQVCMKKLCEHIATAKTPPHGGWARILCHPCLATRSLIYRGHHNAEPQPFEPVRFTFENRQFFLQTMASPDSRFVYHFVQMAGSSAECESYAARIEIAPTVMGKMTNAVQQCRVTPLDFHCLDDLHLIGESLVITEKMFLNLLHWDKANNRYQFKLEVKVTRI